MMYNFDGELYALNEDWGYAVEITNDVPEDVEKIKNKFIEKYISYLIENKQLQFIYREGDKDVAFQTNGTCSIKFKRIEGDSLK